MRFITTVILAAALALSTSALSACGGSGHDVDRPSPTAYCFALSATVGGEQLYNELCSEHQATCVAAQSLSSALFTFGPLSGATTSCTATYAEPEPEPPEPEREAPAPPPRP